MFEELEKINQKPGPFEFYTAKELWTDEYTSKRMLEFHLNGTVDISSRNFKFIEKSVDWIMRHFKLGHDSKIIDFGCGPGLYATLLAGKGANVTGIDFSKNSIQYAENTAKQKGLNITYICQNYLEFQTDEKYDLVIMIMNDFCALSPAQRKTLLNIFKNILKADGSILLDVYSLSAYNQRQEAASCEPNLLNGFWSKEKYYGFLNTFKYDEEKVILDKYTIIEPNRTQVIYNWLQYFDKDSISGQFEQNGFHIEEFYSNVAGQSFTPDSNETAIVAKKL
ncbi:class I SAM-dependent methyltransferase [Planctomycetota bacterium]